MAGRVQIVREVYCCVWTYRARFLRRSIPALALFLIAGLATAGVRSQWIEFAASLPAMLILSRLLTSWHRFVINGTEPQGSVIVPDGTDVRFLVALLGVDLLWKIPSLLLVFLPATLSVALLVVLPAMLAVMSGLAWFMARIVFLFPLIALQEADALRTAWTLSRGNAWRIFLAGFFVALPLVVLSVLLGFVLFLAGRLGIGGTDLMAAVIGAPMSILSRVVFATLMARLFLLRTDPGPALQPS